MKRAFSTAIALVMLSASIQSVGAEALSAAEFYLKTLEVSDKYVAEYQPDIELKIGENKLYIDGEEKAIDSAPVIIDSRTYLPLRAVSESFGAEVGYEGESKVITVKLENLTAKLQIGSRIIEMMFENGISEDYTVEMPVEPVIDENSRCLVPIRSISEDIFGCEVSWNGDEQSVRLSHEYQAKRLIVQANIPDYDFGEIPLAELFSNKKNYSILQFSLDTPDTVVRRYCSKLNEQPDIEYAIADKLIKINL